MLCCIKLGLHIDQKYVENKASYPDLHILDESSHSSEIIGSLITFPAASVSGNKSPKACKFSTFVECRVECAVWFGPWLHVETWPLCCSSVTTKQDWINTTFENKFSGFLANSKICMCLEDNPWWVYYQYQILLIVKLRQGSGKDRQGKARMAKGERP